MKISALVLDNKIQQYSKGCSNDVVRPISVYEVHFWKQDSYFDLRFHYYSRVTTNPCRRSQHPQFGMWPVSLRCKYITVFYASLVGFEGLASLILRLKKSSDTGRSVTSLQGKFWIQTKY